MPKIFVPSDTAQIVSFAAKIVVGLTIPQIASLISFVSSPKALIFFFFGDFGNLFALANDIRWYPSVRKQRERKHAVHFDSFLTVLIAILFCSAVLVTDLLLFQLTAREDGYQLKQTRTNITFNDDYQLIGNSRFPYPRLLLAYSPQTVFRNIHYASNDGGVYKNYTTVQNDFFTIDGPQGDIEVTGIYKREPRCTVMHRLDPSLAADRVCPVHVICYLYNSSDGSISIDQEVGNTLGYNGKKVASYYQTKEGANYLFVELVQRIYDNLETYNRNSGEYILDGKIKDLEDQGYKLENAVMNFMSFDTANNNWSLKELLKLSVENALKLNKTRADCNFLFSKTELTYNYGTIPVYTKNFIVWDTFLETTFFSEEGGSGNIFSYSYDTRQYLVKGRQLRKTTYGIKTAFMVDTPISVEITTDLSDDEIVIATLLHPNHPLRIVETEMVDILPGVIVIGICGLFVIISIAINQFGRHRSNTQLPFDINLEIFHKALENLNGLNAWFLSAKLEGSKNIAMTKGVSLISNKYAVGLVPTGGITDDSLELQSRSLREETKSLSSFKDAAISPVVSNSRLIGLSKYQGYQAPAPQPPRQSHTSLDSQDLQNHRLDQQNLLNDV